MTIKKKRTFVSTLVALFATTAMTASAFAASFYFDLQAGEDDYSGLAIKRNYLSYATADVERGNFNDNNRLYLRVCENERASDGVYYFATETKWVNAKYYGLQLDYYDGEDVYGDDYRLRGYQAANQSVWASGTWNP